MPRDFAKENPVAGAKKRLGVVDAREYKARQSRRQVLKNIKRTLHSGLGLLVLSKSGLLSNDDMVRDDVATVADIKAQGGDAFLQNENKASDFDKLSKLAYQFSNPKDVRVSIDSARERMKNLGPTVMEAALFTEKKYGKYFSSLPVEVRPLIYGLIIQESTADFKKRSIDDDGNIVAMGYTQMTEPMAKAHGMKVTNGFDDERLNPDIILPESVKELKEAYAHWGDWGMATWEWHAGRGNLNDFVDLFLRDNITLGRKIAADELPKYLRTNKIDVFKVLSFGKLRSMLANNPRMDKTQDYLENVVCAALAFEEYKSKV